MAARGLGVTVVEPHFGVGQLVDQRAFHQRRAN